MPLVSSDAIVLHAFDYLESSRILRLVTRDAGVRSVLAFGRKLIRLDLLNYCLRNADNVVVGYFCGMPQLGLYDKAYRLLCEAVAEETAQHPEGTP